MTILGLLAAAACTPGAPVTPGVRTIAVPAAVETQAVATANADAADDPAIWAAPAGSTTTLKGSPIDGFIAGTDKKAGLYIYAFDGKELQFLPEGLLNNVDLRDGIMVDGRSQIVIGASDRGRRGVALYLFDPASTDPANAIRPWGFIPSDVVEPYGFCMGKRGSDLFALLIAKDGQVRQYRIEKEGNQPRGSEVRRFAVGSQSEGCVVDDVSDRLYIGEEMKGLWSYSFAPDGGSERTSVEAVGASGRLVADVEGVTLIRDKKATFLLVSSQGDSAFAVWQVDDDLPVYRGRFVVVANGSVDAVSGTDGIDAHSGPTGPFPEGLVVVQDDVNEGATQNFKLIDWRAIKSALGL